MEEQGAFDH